MESVVLGRVFRWVGQWFSFRIKRHGVYFVEFITLKVSAKNTIETKKV